MRGGLCVMFMDYDIVYILIFTKTKRIISFKFKLKHFNDEYHKYILK